MKLSHLLNKFAFICVFSLIFLFVSITPVLSGNEIGSCDDPRTPKIEECPVRSRCEKASDCPCNQSAACIDGLCSCTSSGVGISNEYCSECVNNYQSCHVYNDPVYEIRWCGGGSGPQGNCIPDAVQDAPLSCDGGPGSFNQMDGFLYKQYGKVNIDDEYETRLAGIGFTCDPFASSGNFCPSNDQSLTSSIPYEGYFQADEDAYYQFATTFSPVAYVYLDVNGNDVFDDNGNTC